MKLKLLFITVLVFCFGLFSQAQSTINITTTGGSFAGEKWVSVTDMQDGAGTEFYVQGATYGADSGLINEDITLPPGTYWVNCYDQYADSWDGTTINVTAYGSSIGDNGGVSPNDGTDTDATFSFEEPRLLEQEASFMIVVPAPPACQAPGMITSNNITDISADFSWTAFTSETGGYSWEVVPQGDGQGVNVVSNGTTATGITTVNVTGLSAATDYDFYIQTNCTAGSSIFSPNFSFSTECTAITTDYNADMSVNVPLCWKEADSGNAASGPMDLGSGTWTSSNHNGSPSNRINIWQGIRSDWIISPVFDLSAAAPSELNIYVALTEGGTSGSGADLGSDDRVSLLMTIDNGVTWTEMQAWIQGTVPTDIGEEISYDLTAITGNVQFAFLGDEGSVDDMEDVYFHVSKFQVRETPACPDTTNLTLVSNTAVEATINFDSGNAASLGNYEYSLTTMAATAPSVTGMWTDVAGANPNVTYTIPALMPETEYFVYVREVCVGGAQGSWTVVPLNFTTACLALTAPYSENFDAPNIPSCYSQEATAGDPWVFDGISWNTSECSASPTDHSPLGTGNFASLDHSGTDTAVILNLPFIDVTSLTIPFISFYHFMCTTGYSPANELYVEAFDGTTWNQVGLVNTGDAVWNLNGFSLAGFDVAGIVELRFRAESGGSSNDFYGDVAIDDISVEEAPSCIDVNAVTLDAVTSDSITVSWSENNIPALTAWEVVAVAAGAPAPAAGVTNATVNPFTIPSLAPGTFYDVYVRTDCSTVFVGPLSVLTDCAGVTSYPSITDFTNNVPSPCWSEAGAGEIATGPSGIGSSDWRAGRAYTDFSGTVIPSNAMNLFSDIDREWLISEVFDLSSLTTKVLTIEVALTDWIGSGTSTAASAGVMGSDDTVDLLVTEDAGVTWTSIQTWTAANQPATIGERYNFDLAAYAGSVQFAFLASDGTADDPEDYDFHVGRFIIDTTAGNEDVTLENQISLYPNPVNGNSVTVNFGNLTLNKPSIVIYNTLGQRVINRGVINISNNTLTINNLEVLKTGMYFMHISNGSTIAVKRFIIE